MNIRKATQQDIDLMVDLSRIKRLDYEKAQPQFWRYAPQAEEIQSKWFEELLARDDHILLVAESEKEIAGFIIGRVIEAPEVYNPGGLTLMIDDFCIRLFGQWESIGSKLLAELQATAKLKCATQTLVVCGAHDEPKREFLRKCGLGVASEWYVGEIV